MQSVSSGAVYNAIGAIQSNLNNKANGNMNVYFRAISPYQLNNSMASIIGEYSVGSLVIFQTTWEDYQTYWGAGGIGCIFIVGGSSYALAQLTFYGSRRFNYGGYCTDNANNWSGWSSI